MTRAVSQVAQCPRGDLDHAFVRRFESAWLSRDAERLTELLHPDVELVQPLAPRLLGREQGKQSMQKFLAAIPDLETTLLDALVRDSTVFIQFRFAGTLGAKHVEWEIVDRIDLVDGLVKKRASYFDPLSLLRALALQPCYWGSLLSLLRPNR